MEKQLLPEIDRERTKEAVEKALEKYRIFSISVPEEHLPKVTASYTLTPPANTNAFHSPTEDAVIKNVDYHIEREKYIKQIQKAVNRLAFQERALIIKRYMSDEDVFDYTIYNELHISERKYYRIKSRAFYKLAFAMKLEVYTNEGV